MKKNHWTDKYAATACSKGLAEARQYPTLQAWWEATEHWGWMCWLLDRIGWPEGAPAEYERVAATALAEYERVAATALAEYSRVCAIALRRIVPCPSCENKPQNGWSAARR